MSRLRFRISDRWSRIDFTMVGWLLLALSALAITALGIVGV